MRFPTLLLATFALGASTLGCGDGGPASPLPRLVAIGRLERGSTIRFVARDGASAADSLVTNVAVSPTVAGAASASTLRLLQAGQVTVSATASDGRTITTQLDVALPPTVFFDAVVSSNRDIYSISLDGGDMKRVTTSAADDSHPSVAGGTIVFSSTRDGNGELYSLSVAAGGAEKRLTTSAANETQPTLSNGGTSVAYVSDAGGLSRIFVGPATTVGAARLTAASFGFGGSIETDPTWSPTSDRIAFTSTANGRANLFISSSGAGSTPATVAGSGSQETDVEPSWSPDGNRIAFASTRAGGTQIFLLDLRNGSFNQVTQGAGSNGQPAWLPDGRLLYTSFSGSESTLSWVDPATTAPPVEIPTGTKAPAHATALRP